jgi:hypothetical protein
MASNTITWILPTIKWGTPGADGAMSSALTALGGRIKQDSTELSPVDGDTKSAKDALGRYIDMIRLDQNYELKTTLIGQSIDDIATILGLTATGTAGAKSLGINEIMIKGFKSIDVIPNEAGQLELQMPLCRVFTGIGHNGTDGYYMPLTIVPMIPGTGTRLILKEYVEEVPAG